MILFYIVAFVVGISMGYVLAPYKNKQLKYPTDQNTIYVDDQGVCYRYHKQYIDC